MYSAIRVVTSESTKRVFNLLVVVGEGDLRLVRLHELAIRSLVPVNVVDSVRLIVVAGTQIHLKYARVAFVQQWRSLHSTRL